MSHPSENRRIAKPAHWLGYGLVVAFSALCVSFVFWPGLFPSRPEALTRTPSGTESVRSDDIDDGSEPAAETLPHRLTSANLPNPIFIHDRVISGGLPEGEDAFRELAQRGIKTIISVDGMTPNVELAAKHGMRYVHLPHGYDGIPDQRILELAKAVRDLDAPIYIHCHHGKHRSPAAASVACVAAGMIPRDQAMAILRLAGTDTVYKGLYAAARSATLLGDGLLGNLQVEFKSIQTIPPIAEAMVHLDKAREHLDLIAASDWKAPAEHPDLDPAHEAMLLRELYTELLRTKDVAQQPADFRNWLSKSESTARELTEVLRRWHDEGAQEPVPKKFFELSRRISSDCKSCHAKYRDVPIRH